MASVALSAKLSGSIVKIKENGVLQDFYVVRQGYPTDGNGRTALARRYIYDSRQWHTSNVNAYAGSAIDTWLTTTYLAMLPSDIQSQIAYVNIPYTPGNGNTTVTTLSRRVFIASLTEMGFGSAGVANVEGSNLHGISGIRPPLNSSGTAVTSWTRSPYITSIQSAFYVTATGIFGSTTPTSSHGVIPIFTLPSTIRVGDDGVVFINNKPVISYTGGTALGVKTEGFAVDYSVSDSNGDAVTVTEKLNDITKRTHTPTLGAAQQVQAVLPANFQTVLNGDHTINISATDGMDAATPKNITFTKAVYSCSITLSNPLPADDMPTAMRLGITGSIPDEATWTAEVCNNGNDASPTWENIKPAMQGGFNYLFTNTTKTAAEWGVNFRVGVTRLGDTGGYIYAVEGGFQ